MAIRLQSEFRSLNDDQYRIKIIDSAYLGAPYDVTLSANGFTLTHDGETDTIFSPIIGSSVSLTIYNDSTLVDSFRTALLNAQDKQFSIRIERWTKNRSRNFADEFRNRVISDGGVYEAGDCLNDALTALGVGGETRADVWQQSNETRVESDGGVYEAGSCVVDAINALGSSKTLPDSEFDLYWTGYVTQDLVEEADESKPRAIQLRASDGVSILSTIDYEFTLSQSFQKTFKDAIIEMMTNAGIDSLFESDEVMLTSVVNWYANEHVYSSTSDPLDNTKTDLKAFTETNSSGVREYTNALDIIRQICLIFNARFYFDDGSFRFEQLSERDNIDIREFYYLNDGTSDSNAVVQLDTIIDQKTAHRAEGVFRHLPAVKSVRLTQEKISSANIIGRAVIFPTDAIDVGVIPSANNGRLVLQIKTEIQTYISNALQGTATPLFGVTIRLEPTDGSATRYWKNSLIVNSLVFGTGSWSTTSDTFKFAGNTVSRSSSLKTTTQYAMTTGPLPTDGEIFIDIDFLGFYDFGLDPTFISSPNSYAWRATLQTAQFENDNEPTAIVQSIYEANNTSTALGSNITIDLGDTILGDGAGSMGSLYVNNSSAYVPSTGWRVANSGSFIDIAKLSTREVLSVQSSVVRRFEGKIINAGGFKNRLRFDSAYWLPLRSTFVANSDEFEVECFQIARVVDDVDVSSDPIDIGDDSLVVAVADFNGMYSNVGSGSVADMPIDFDNQSIGPYKQKTDGTAQITDDLQIDGAANAPSVQLTGGSGAQGTFEWNGDEDTVALTMNGIEHFLGQDMVYNVKNQSGASIDKGVAVMASGTLGSSGRLTIVRAEADGSVPAKYFLGVTAENIANGADGKVIEFGKIGELNTEAYSDGDVLWLDPAVAGGFTPIEPSAPNLKIPTAIVINAHATQGIILVRATQGMKLDDLHNVEITSPTMGQVLMYNSDTGVWYNASLPT